ncbi:hypothetical protein Naga_100021g39 [Nannochloropsis gaditana]|uniref:Uncharacterized protein n=1 Tax=Nannochloropsis gaditana TaxID=72520 RepID=W7TZH4_9STRA|nr:hypothetical protein Naga_100021g39 [Nannochloropsis gaditana]
MFPSLAQFRYTNGPEIAERILNPPVAETFGSKFFRYISVGYTPMRLNQPAKSLVRDERIFENYLSHKILSMD